MTTSFAAIGTLGAGSGTRTAISFASVATDTNSLGSTQAPLDTETLLDYFTEPYFFAHELSWPSFRYAYILWIVVGFVAVVFAVCHVMLRRRAGEAVAAGVRKVAMKRLQIGSTKANSKRRFWVSPPLGYVALLLAFTVAIFCLSYVGPDYLAPTECTWGGVCPAAVSASPPKTTFGTQSGPQRRDWMPALPLPGGSVALIKRSLPLIRRQGLNPNGWAPCQ
jgi:hypothetical protein